MPNFHPYRFKRFVRSGKGSAIRWFKAFDSSNYNPTYNTYDQSSPIPTEFGYCYEEQLLDPACSVLVTNFRTTIANSDGVLIRTGNAQIAVLEENVILGFVPPGGSPVMTPSDEELRFSRMDKIMLLSEQWAERMTEVVRKGNDKLHHSPAIKLLRVMQMGISSNTVYEIGVDVILNLTTNTLQWISGTHPNSGEDYTVQYLYTPTFFYLGDENMSGFPTPNGRMYQSGRIVMKHPSALDTSPGGG